jgi:hypothetical protein
MEPTEYSSDYVRPDPDAPWVVYEEDEPDEQDCN